jgi:hypothetical protein
MLTTFIILTCLAALWVGWTLGPLGIIIARKIKVLVQDAAEKIEESAQKSTEKSKIDNKYYSTLGISINDEKSASKTETWRDLVITTFFFTFLAFAVISGYSIFWKLFLLMFLIMFWKHILAFAWELLLSPFAEKKKAK